MSGLWSDGQYERTAAELEPAAVALIEAIAPGDGELLLDVACGTGNAGVLALERGAEVIGIDTAERLLDVARERCGPGAEFVAGDATALAFEDGSFDLAVSVFGVTNGILSGQVADAVAEMSRVLRPGGRLALAVWHRSGAVFEVIGLLRGAMTAPGSGHARSTEPPSELEVVRAQPGLERVSATDRQLTFTSRSPGAWWDDQSTHHPVWRTLRAKLGDPDRWADLRAEALPLLEAANEDREALAITSSYSVITATRAA